MGGLLVSVGVIAIFVWSVVRPWNIEHVNGSESMTEDMIHLAQPYSATAYRPVNPRPRQPGSQTSAGHVLPSWNHLASRTDLGLSDRERDLVMELERESGVPGWVLYGLWCQRSGCLSGGWQQSGDWQRSRDMALDPNSRCRRERSQDCLEEWRALQSICRQCRPDGSAVCNPDEVWSSYALALGQLQQLPRHFILTEDWHWQDHIVDYDGDGVYDPHRLDDALASVATALRNGIITHGSLPAAMQVYAGNAEPELYTLLRDQYYSRWCAVDGYCAD